MPLRGLDVRELPGMLLVVERARRPIDRIGMILYGLSVVFFGAALVLFALSSERDGRIALGVGGVIGLIASGRVLLKAASKA